MKKWLLAGVLAMGLVAGGMGASEASAQYPHHHHHCGSYGGYSTGYRGVPVYGSYYGPSVGYSTYYGGYAPVVRSYPYSGFAPSYYGTGYRGVGVSIGIGGLGYGSGIGLGGFGTPFGGFRPGF